MTMTWYVARGDLEPDPDLALLPWACTGCLACRERCEHKNPVAPTLVAARSGFRDEGLVPPGAQALRTRFASRRQRLRERALSLRGSGARAEQALLIGCGYLGARGTEAADAVQAARGLLGTVDVLEGCCGLAFREAGDPMRADEERAALLSELGARPLVVADAGCAFELGKRARTLAEAAASLPERLGRVSGLAPLRWHDPCRLARGLGVEQEPRAVLARALGAPPLEFERRGVLAHCSGAGALLPFAMPRTAREIARARLAEHERLGGGTIVTGCATSLGWFRAQGARALDLSTVIARSVQGG
jgi:Fe-S oxidoreductase